MSLHCFKHNQDSIGTCNNYNITSINAISKPQIQLSIYPNPANTDITIQYQLNQPNGILKLYNTIGQLVSAVKVSSSTSKIEENVSFLKPGIYYYMLSIDGITTVTKKLVIIR